MSTSKDLNLDTSPNTIIVKQPAIRENQITKLVLKKLKKLVTTSKSSRTSHDKSEFHIKSLTNKIIQLKSFKLTRLPENVLHHYLFCIAELQIAYGNSALRRANPATLPDVNKIDLNFIQNLLKYSESHGNELVNFKNQYDDCVLHEACKLKSDDLIHLVKMLNSKGARLDALNAYGHSVFHVAASFDNASLIEYLFTVEGQLALSKSYVENQTPLHYASKNGAIETMKLYEKLLGDQFNEKIEEKDYQGRTCLYLAAEYGNGNVAQMLIECGCEINVTNIHDQNALYWIIAKCPQMASKVLDKFKDQAEYSLHHLELKPIKDDNGITKVPEAKTILQFIVENKKIDLIVHPVIYHLVQVKWIEFGRQRCYLSLTLTSIFIVSCIILGTYAPRDQRHYYVFPEDWWRVFLYVIGILGTVVSVIVEMLQYYFSIRSQKDCDEKRKKELMNDMRFYHPHDHKQELYLNQEKQALVNFKKVPLHSNFFNLWKFYELILIGLLLAVTISHFLDVANHTEERTRTNVRIFSVAVIFISLKFLSIFRNLFEQFGILVIILSSSLQRILVWFCVFVIFWIPFTTAFWMLFGGKRFEYTNDTQTNCTDITNPGSHCTVVSVTNMATYDQLLFFLWTAAMGREFDRENMKRVDNIMGDVLIAVFVSVFVLLLVNIFIAYMTSTFERVYGSSKAFFTLERAAEVITLEHAHRTKRLKHLEKLNHYVKTIEQENVLDLEEISVKRIQKASEEMQKKLEKLNMKCAELVFLTKVGAESEPLVSNDKGSAGEKLKSDFKNLTTEIIELKQLIMEHI